MKDRDIDMIRDRDRLCNMEWHTLAGEKWEEEAIDESRKEGETHRQQQRRKKQLQQTPRS